MFDGLPGLLLPGRGGKRVSGDGRRGKKERRIIGEENLARGAIQKASFLAGRC